MAENLLGYSIEFIFSYGTPKKKAIHIRGGVVIGEKTFIGRDVYFDELTTDSIRVGKNCTITAGTKILCHFFNTKDRCFYQGNVTIGDNVFIGMNTLIIKPVSIGNNSIIGAGSVVTQDIPENVIAAGNPCKIIKKI